jgi:hypothetical protein
MGRGSSNLLYGQPDNNSISRSCDIQRLLTGGEVLEAYQAYLQNYNSLDIQQVNDYSDQLAEQGTAYLLNKYLRNVSDKFKPELVYRSNEIKQLQTLLNDSLINLSKQPEQYTDSIDTLAIEQLHKTSTLGPLGNSFTYSGTGYFKGEKGDQYLEYFFDQQRPIDIILTGVKRLHPLMLKKLTEDPDLEPMNDTSRSNQFENYRNKILRNVLSFNLYQRLDFISKFSVDSEDNQTNSKDRFKDLELSKQAIVNADEKELETLSLDTTPPQRINAASLREKHKVFDRLIIEALVSPLKSQDYNYNTFKEIITSDDYSGKIGNKIASLLKEAYQINNFDFIASALCHNNKEFVDNFKS